MTAIVRLYTPFLLSLYVGALQGLGFQALLQQVGGVHHLWTGGGHGTTNLSNFTYL